VIKDILQPTQLLLILVVGSTRPRRARCAGSAFRAFCGDGRAGQGGTLDAAQATGTRAGHGRSVVPSAYVLP
jgi:hypothetical protein